MLEKTVLDEHMLQPLKSYGFTHPFFTLNATTIIYTWLMLVILLVILIVLRYYLPKKESLLRYMSTSAAELLIGFMKQSVGFFSYKQGAFIASLFIFILMCNLASLIPYFEEPTQDLNTALALGIISFLYTQFHAIKAHGLLGYIKEFFSPIFIMLPINIIGELASIISISFRLYGNIFGGSIISTIYFGAIKNSILWETVGIIIPVSLLIKIFFGFFEGVIQALVFTMLSLTYLSLAIAQEE